MIFFDCHELKYTLIYTSISQMNIHICSGVCSTLRLSIFPSSTRVRLNVTPPFGFPRCMRCRPSFRLFHIEDVQKLGLQRMHRGNPKETSWGLFYHDKNTEIHKAQALAWAFYFGLLLLMKVWKGDTSDLQRDHVRLIVLYCAFGICDM